MNSRRTLLVYAAWLCFLQMAIAANLPSDWTKCKQSDPKFTECLKKAVSDAVKRMGSKGEHSLGVLPLDPMDVDEIRVDNGGSQSVKVNLLFKKLKIFGPADGVVTSIEPRLKDYKLIIDSVTPNVTLNSGYELDGSILVLPIKGNGQCQIILSQLKMRMELIGEPLKKDGETYMKLRDMKIKLIPKRMYLHFDNLFNGDKALGDNMNAFLNENWEILRDELLPSFDDALGQVFLQIARRIFNKVPLNKIFPE